MQPTPKEPLIGQDTPHQRLIEGDEALCPDLTPGQRLPDGRQVPIPCHPAGEAEVKDREGRNPP